ncbi:hypothetical protein J7U46_16385 [Pelomonas sp. V22]|uniref:hypothetical protein n=1 Tax=Pelomonas sp. V22 TaxID=2822139 RepID=UPI0024A90159|nr:hypothetical protein [Pelomonas sp. V22]MDI4634639.1 hypothetical protein [Pelomonas sp. V22]
MSELHQLWKGQPAEPLQALAAEELAQKAAAFHKRIARRNRSERLSAAIVVPVFLLYAWIFPYWVTKIGALLIVAGIFVLLWQLKRRAEAADPARALGLDLLAFHRAELVRQRDALRSVWLWYIGPLLPGLLLFLWGRQQELATPAAQAWHPWVNAITALVLLGIVLLNLWMARKLQRQIDEIDKVSEPKQEENP